MNKKYKATGCARLFIFMLIFAPLAYLSAAYFQGENGIENIKEMLNLEQPADQKIKAKTAEITALRAKIELLKEEIEQLQKEATVRQHEDPR